MSDKRTLLLVEDDDVYRESVHRLLENDFELLDAPTGDEALKMAGDQPVDCVLLDYRLPDYTGLALLAELTKHGCPVIMLTARGNQQIAVDAMKQGCHDYLVKSDLTRELLSRAVSSAIDKSRLQQDLVTVELRLERALSGANVGIWDWDVRTNEVYVSPQLTEQLGYGPDVVWNSLDDFTNSLHPQDHDGTLQHIRDYLDGKSNEYNQTFRLRHQDGSYRWIMSKGVVSRDDNDQPLHMIGVHVDITDRKMRENDLERINLELKQLCHAASHDLREPIRAVTGCTQILERKLDNQLDEESRDLMNRVVAAASRLHALIEDISTYSQFEVDIRRFEPTDLSAVVANVISDLDDSIQGTSGVVVCDPLPTVTGDRHLLEMLFHHLISNAIVFHNNRPPEVHITSQRESDSDHWTISVRDNGIGIKPEHQKKIFDVFRRLHHRNDHHGNGIGLALCRRIVEQHRGCMWLESEPGVGSVFFLSLPVC